MKTDFAEKWPDGTPIAKLETNAAYEYAAECLGLSVRPSIWGAIAVDANTGVRVPLARRAGVLAPDASGPIMRTVSRGFGGGGGARVEAGAAQCGMGHHVRLGAELGAAAWHAVMGHDPRRCVWRCRCGLSGVRANP